MTRFSIIEWNELTNGDFSVKFVVSSSAQETIETYTITVPFQGEDPQLFLNKLRNYMISHVSYLDNSKTVKQLMSKFSFTDPTVHYYQHIGESNVS